MLEIPGEDDLVDCYSDTDNCVGPFRITTRAKCCDNRGKEPADYGFSVWTDGEGCSRCPTSIAELDILPYCNDFSCLQLLDLLRLHLSSLREDMIIGYSLDFYQEGLTLSLCSL